MALTLVTGRANSGKTGVLHAALRDALAAGVPVTLLLPTMPDVRRTEAELGREGMIGARVAVLDGWIDGLWALHGDGRRVVSDAVRQVLLQRAVAQTPLDAVASSASSPGFVALLADVARRLTGVPAAEGRGVEAEVARVLREYDRIAAEAGYVERSVAARVLAAHPPDLPGPVLVNRFTSLSEAQEALLRGLAERNRVVVALTWEPDLPATAAIDPLIERMFASAETIPLTPPFLDDELGRLEERLYCPGAPITAEGMVAFGLAAGDEAECVLAARAARSLVEEGFAPERVAVVFRDVGRRLGLLAASLSAEGVEADVDVAVPIAATPMGAAFGALIEACVSPSRERLLAWLLGPYSGADAEAVAKLDARWRRYRVAGERLLRDAEGLGGVTAEAIAAGRRTARGLQDSTLDAWRCVADALIRASGPVHAEGSPERMLDAAVHRALHAAFSDAVSVSGARLTANDVLRLTGRMEAPVGSAEREGAVQVTEAHRLRSRRFDAVVLGGLTAEEFSAERPQPLSAEIAERLGALPDMQEREAERLLFYLVATRARRRLVLLRQERDARGEEKRPSVFWDEVVDLYADAEAGEEAPPVPPGVVPARLALTDLASAAPAYALGRREQRAAVAGSGRDGRRRGRLEEERVLEALAATAEFSVTELETYLACPYRWFYERAVRPRELDAEVDARERGSRAHRILAVFYAALREDGTGRVTPEGLDAALTLLDEVSAGVEHAADTRAVTLGEELALAEAHEWARRIVTDDAELLPDFSPLEHELAFGEAAGRRFELGGVALRGSVDRVDAGPEGLVVTDYKSGRTPAGWASFGGKGLIQLPAYAAAASALLERPVAAAVYRSLRSLAMRGFVHPGLDLGSRGSSRDVVDAETMERIAEEAAEAVRRAAEGIRAGEIGPRPSNSSGCEWCGARALCEVGR